MMPSMPGSNPVACGPLEDDELSERANDISSEILPSMKKPGFLPGESQSTDGNISFEIMSQGKGATLPLFDTVDAVSSQHIWQRLDGLRQLNGLTQDQIADRLGLDNNGLVSLVLKGKRSIPIQSLGKWIDAFSPPTPALRQELITIAIREYGAGYVTQLRDAAIEAAKEFRVVVELLSDGGLQVPESVTQSLDRLEKIIRFDWDSGEPAGRDS